MLWFELLFSPLLSWQYQLGVSFWLIDVAGHPSLSSQAPSLYSWQYQPGVSFWLIDVRILHGANLRATRLSNLGKAEAEGVEKSRRYGMGGGKKQSKGRCWRSPSAAAISKSDHGEMAHKRLARDASASWQRQPSCDSLFLHHDSVMVDASLCSSKVHFLGTASMMLQLSFLRLFCLYNLFLLHNLW